MRDEQGRVVALIETGTDLCTFRVENARLVRELAVRLATLLIVLALVPVEVAFVAGILRRCPRLDRRGQRVGVHRPACAGQPGRGVPVRSEG